MATFTNINVCRSFNTTLTLNTLTSLTAQECSEVVVYNKTGGKVEIYDSDYSAAANAFILNDGDSFVVRGITNSNQVSAKAVGLSGLICYRTQYYSNFTQGR